MRIATAYHPGGNSNQKGTVVIFNNLQVSKKCQDLFFCFNFYALSFTKQFLGCLYYLWLLCSHHSKEWIDWLLLNYEHAYCSYYLQSFAESGKQSLYFLLYVLFLSGPPCNYWTGILLLNYERAYFSYFLHSFAQSGKQAFDFFTVRTVSKWSPV